MKDRHALDTDASFDEVVEADIGIGEARTHRNGKAFNRCDQHQRYPRGQSHSSSQGTHRQHTMNKQKRAVALGAKSLSNRAIAKRLGVFHTLVNRWLSTHASGNTSRNTTALEDRLIQRFRYRAFDLNALEQLCKDDESMKKPCKS